MVPGLCTSGGCRLQNVSIIGDRTFSQGMSQTSVPTNGLRKADESTSLRRRHRSNRTSNEPCLCCKYASCSLATSSDQTQYKRETSTKDFAFGQAIGPGDRSISSRGKRGGKRPDNCEYPWEDDKRVLH